MRLTKILTKIDNFLLFALIFVTPLVFSNLFAIAVDTSKLVFATSTLVLVLLVKALKLFLSGEFSFKSSKLDFPVLLLAASYLVAGIFATTNKMEAFAIPGVATVVLVCALTYLLVNQFETATKEILKNVLLASGVVVAIFSLLASANLLTGMTFLPEFAKDSQFNLTGSVSSTLIVLASLLMVGVAKAVFEKDVSKKVLYGVASGVLAFGLIVNISKFLPGSTSIPRLPSMNTSWSVAVDTLKVSPILGSGPGNYIGAFSQFRPLAYNQTDLWNVRFGFSRSHFLTILTEAGLLAGAGTIILLLAILNQSKSALKAFGSKYYFDETSLSYLAVTLGFGLLLFFPANFSALLILFALLAINTKTNSFSTKFFPEGTQGFASRIPALVLILPVLVGAVLFFINAYNIVSADMLFRRSILALSQNDAQTTYDLMREATIRNPQIDRYRFNFAQVNFSLANSIASAASQEGAEELTEEERATITQLIQQAINESRAAVALNPTRADNWEALGSIYRSIASLAEGAGDFALQSYSQAVALDPINPVLRIALGSIFYAAQDFENAIVSFRLATQAKPDYANGHYNLAIAYRDSGQIDKAIDSMQIVLSLVEKDSNDFEIATAELANLESQRPASTTPEDSETLSAPQDLEPTLNPPIQLDGGAAPDIDEEDEGPPGTSASPTP